MDRYAKHGGIHFEQLAPASEINRFVNQLPQSDRENLFEVLDHLNHAGLIKLINDGVYTDGEGVVHGKGPNEHHAT